MAQNNQDEIDLGYLFGKISGLFRSFVRLLFMIIAFFMKYFLIFLILIIVGVVLGYFVDKNKTEIYNNELIVIPNFESTQYFYDRIDELSAKLKNNDSLFLKTILGREFKNLKKIEAEPIIDIFSYATSSPTRVELFKILTDKQDIPKFLIDPQNFQYYKYHHLYIKIEGKDSSKEIVNNLMDFLNDSPHFNDYMGEGRKNTEFRIANTEKTIIKIDSILSASGQRTNTNTPSVLVSDNSQLNDVIESKERMMYSLLRLNMQKIDEQNIIKVASINYNISEVSIFRVSNKLKYPLLLVLLFSGFFFLRYIYKKMKHIAETNAR
ncbi:hypothetical protein Aeqsu_1210 [Aequorivita sublithincola DSM 14238]|uniref:Chain length determinant protein n=1 Tax=Aequorivita sublithincola (strain DSM 14238 / LMG 21431 / ACAM 643 / 9-3) TaxID=746697 RepID=I3YUN8_AEQSU|nr:hypothetical protein [Aequorivita sublithincola]AFL80706.1 hypothetical protein Aeqsu_1210 [Aequorivita sublithincola DSM 14238]